MIRKTLRTAVAAIALIAAVPALAVVATQTVTLSTSAWTDLGTGPMQVSAVGGPIAYQIADEQPTSGAGYGLVITDKPAAVATGSHVWAKALASGSKAQVAPSGSSTGSGLSDANTQRVVIATDSPNLSYSTVSVASLTRPTGTTTYTANTGWNNATSSATGVFTFANACASAGGNVLIPEIDIYSSNNPATKLAGALWLSSVAPGTIIADNAAFTIAAADFANVKGPMGGIPFTLGNLQASGAANSAVTLAGTTYHAQCGNLTRNLYGIVEVTNAYVPAASETLTIKLHTVGVGEVQSAPSTGPTPPTGFASTDLVFNEEFDTLNSARWNTAVGSSSAFPWNSDGTGGSGMGNTNNAEYMRPSQATVSNGLLTLRAIKQSVVGRASGASYTFPWTSGVVSTYGKVAIKGGYINVRMKPPAGNGQWASIWMLPSSGGSDSQEIDIYEGGYIKSGVATNNVYAPYYHNAGTKYGAMQNAGVDLTAGFHDYGLYWVPGTSLTWYLDGVQIQQITSGTATIPNTAFELLLSMQVANANTTGWHTVWDGTTPSPMDMQIESVQIWQKAGEGNTITGN